MKRGAVLFLCICLVISISFVSAGLFDNLFGKKTGSSVSLSSSCYEVEEKLGSYRSALDELEKKYPMCLGEEIKVDDVCIKFKSDVSYYYSVIAELEKQIEDCLSGGTKDLTPYKPRCSDSDGGHDIYVQGTCEDSEEVIIASIRTDYCQGSGGVLEFYCGSELKCSQDYVSCGFGYECINGACIVSNQTDNCTDTDGGLEYYVFGTIFHNGGYYSQDTCHSQDDSILNEWYCAGSIPAVQAYLCPGGCEEGVCLTNETHLECVNEQCVSVAGPGVDECSSNLDCVNSLNDSTPPVLDIFELGINDSGNQTFISLYAVAHDYESGMQSRSYEFFAPSDPSWGNGGPCPGGDICWIYSSVENPESGLWNVSVSFTNNVGLSVSETQSIYVPGRGFFSGIVDFFSGLF